MSRDKYLVTIIVILVITLLGGGVFWYIYAQKQSKQTQHSQTLGSAYGSNSVSLTQPQSSGDSSGGLSVDQNPQAASLGQLGGDSSRSSGSSNSDAKKSSNPFDPTTFAQYEKYKDAASGLFGEVKVGTGAEATSGKKAVVLYKGWLTDGKLFDESKTDDKGQLQAFAFTIGAHEVIPGWEQTVAGMKVGGTRLVIVPPAAGYGETGHNAVPPNAVLVFQIQLVAVQ